MNCFAQVTKTFLGYALLTTRLRSATLPRNPMGFGARVLLRARARNTGMGTRELRVTPCLLL